MKSDLYNSYKVMESNEGQAVQTISSREVAGMMEVEHKHLLVKIDGFNEIFDGRNIDHKKYWIESNYENSRGKVYRCFEVTKRGCDFLANKSIGEKGVIFTDKYMDRFSEMEQQIQSPFLNASKELQAIFMIDRKQQVIEGRVGAIEEKMTVDYELAENLRTAVNTRAVHLLEGKYSEAYKKLSKKLFSELYRDIKGAFKVNSYKNISLKNYDKALNYIEKWKPSLMLQYAIQGANGQVKLDEMECVTNG
ncbi:Rha family transcriptional regulator [Terrisporobacter hibernicus]|uniref:ORF6C domain-containing protein n=1 Tax=Terrisporobacter hibernicus TaxID=2813371 RepID=A0AAX2ZHI4_9FIRM|nr:Rha family transcriptional regulator [Terrisporobacter hibernicus]UEL47539.1 ORF6C domain-containing protein [Terrisporobacter hibernicus]